MDTTTIALALIGAVVALFAKGKWKETNWAGKLGMIIAIAVILSGASFNCRKVQKENLIEKVTAKFGEFKDLEGATIPRICSGICLGNGMAVNPNGVFHVPETGPLFRVYVRNAKLFVDAVIRDINGKAIAVIDGNEWTMYNEEYEYNNDETGFEIVTKGDRKVFFQIYLEGGIAHVLGMILNESGIGVKFLQDSSALKRNYPIRDEETLLFRLISGTANDSLRKELYKPLDGAIFKYPRAKYFGVRKG